MLNFPGNCKSGTPKNNFPGDCNFVIEGRPQQNEQKMQICPPPLPNVQILGPKMYDPGLPLKRGPGLRGISLKSCVAKVQPAGHTKAAPVQTEAQSHTEGPRAPTKATRGRQMVQHQAPYQCHRALGRPSANKQSQFSGELLGYKIRLSTPGQLMRKSHMETAADGKSRWRGAHHQSREK